MYKVIALESEQVFQISSKQWQQNQKDQAILLRFLAVPLLEQADRLWLGIDGWENLAACETFSFLKGKPVEPVLIATHDLKYLLEELTPQHEVINQVSELYQATKPIPTPITPSQQTKQDEPIIQLLNALFEKALKLKASDIHLEPQTNTLQIRLRIDGVLHRQAPLQKELASRLISRLKILAKLDIAETRLPQDGRFSFQTLYGSEIDFRLSLLPTHWGEKAVLRLQSNKPVKLDFKQLGMTEMQQQTFQQALKQPQGLILVTGPTGSGKSLSLYSALQWLNTDQKHIVTAEDPIEIELEGIIQTQTHFALGLTFSQLLRSFLRQDPDVIMVGEIRDEETAKIALRAAQTGHLVLSTLHTNDAPSAITRLQQLGLSSYEIESVLVLVIAQRLIRQLCQKCQRQSSPSCTCLQKYQGRTGIFQFLTPSHQKQNSGQYQLDYPDLLSVAQLKVKQGITDYAELQRVLGG